MRLLHRTLSTLAMIAAIFIVNDRASAQSAVWERMPIMGGSAQVVAVDSTGRIFAGVGTTLAQSTDDGVTWRYTANSDVGQPILSIAVDREGRVFARSQVGSIRRSTDHGESWQVLREWTGYSAVAVAAAPSGTIFAAMEKGIVRSTDHGDTWADCGVTTKDYVTSMVVGSNGEIYAGAHDGMVLRSTNDGVSWEMVGNAGGGSEVVALAIGAEGDVFAAVTYGVVRLTDAGWILASRGLPKGRVGYIGADRKGNLVAGTWDGGIHRSSDNGVNWTRCSVGSWRRPEYQGEVPGAFAISPGGDIIAGMTGKGISRSSDGGVTWKPFGTLVHAAVGRVEVDPTNDDIFVNAKNRGLIRSTDNGASWQDALPTSAYIEAGQFGITPRGTIVAMDLVDRSAIYRSTDHGETWRKIEVCAFEIQLIGMAISPAGDIYLTGDPKYGDDRLGNIYHSTDDGVTWSLNGSEPRLFHARMLAASNRGPLFATAENALFRSTDNGAHWEMLPDLRYDFLSLATDSRGNVIVSTLNDGTFRSPDDGASWILVKKSPGCDGSECIAVGAWDEVFLIDRKEGPVRLDKSGEWVTIASGLPSGSYYGDMAATSRGYVFITTYGGGLYRTSHSVSSVDDAPVLPEIDLSLEGSRPNPITSDGIIRFRLGSAAQVRATLHDMLGREVSELLDERAAAGEHDVRIDAVGLANGIYHCRVSAGEAVVTRPIVVAR